MTTVKRLSVALAGTVSGEQAGFLATNLIANLIFIVRSYVTMHALDYRDLGIVTLMQTIVLLVGALQFGILNGGYRLLCSADPEGARAINNVGYSSFALIALAGLAIALLFDPLAGPGALLWVVLIGVVAGSLTLVRSWVNNQMIAAGMLASLNRVTMWSALLSLLPLLAISAMPLAACIVSVAIQPALFIAAVLVRQPSLRPDRWSLDHAILGQIFAAGFFIFLGAMLVQLNAQIERWYVVGHLGLEALGHLYLAFLVLNLFSIVPNALQALYMPRIIRAWDGREGPGVGRQLRRLVLSSLAYCLVASVAIAGLAVPIVDMFLPRYAGDLIYVYIVMPGLVVYTLGGAIAVIFNVLIRYRSYNVGFGLGTAFTMAAFLAAISAEYRLSLVEVSLIKAAAYGLSGIVFAAGFWLLSRDYRDFRFGLRDARGPQ